MHRATNDRSLSVSSAQQLEDEAEDNDEMAHQDGQGVSGRDTENGASTSEEVSQSSAIIDHRVRVLRIERSIVISSVSVWSLL